MATTGDLAPMSARGWPPPPKGFRARGPSEQDLDALVALYGEVARARNLEPTTAADIRLRWDGPRWYDEGIIVERKSDGLLAGYAQFTRDVGWDGGLRLWTDGRVSPSATGHGLATFLITRGEVRARQVGAKLPQATRVSLRTTNDNGNDRARQLYERLGFEAIRHLLTMRIDLAKATAVDVASPWGVTIRPVDADADLPQVWAALQLGFADHWDFEPTDYDEWRAILVDRSDRFDPGLWFVAEAAGQVVGAAICHAGDHADRGMGVVQDLAVEPRWRRRHVAMSLLRKAFTTFSDRGLVRAGLEVDDITLEGALRLYEKAGMAVARRTDVYEKVLRPGT